MNQVDLGMEPVPLADRTFQQVAAGAQKVSKALGPVSKSLAVRAWSCCRTLRRRTSLMVSDWLRECSSDLTKC